MVEQAMGEQAMGEQATGDATPPVAWTEMRLGTRDDYQRIRPLVTAHTTAHLADNLLTMLEMLRGPKLGYQVDRYTHSLQSASRTLRADESIDLVVAALLHDIGDVFAPENHSAAAASLLAPYVDETTEWIVRHHGVFQGYYFFHHIDLDQNLRDRFRDAPHFDACARFCEIYDQNCFDPDYPTLPIETFEPLLREVTARPSRFVGDVAGT